MSKTKFIGEFISKLDGKVEDGELNTIMTELSFFLNDWDVQKSKHELVVYEEIPECYKAFMVTKKIEGRSNNTLNLYRMCLEDMLHTICKPVSEISTNDIRIYLYTLQKERNIGNRTLDSRRLIMNSFFSWCTDEGYILHNPCAAIAPIKYEVKPRQPFTDIEMEIIRSACKTPREKAMIEIFYSTGCRCSELARLKIKDIDFTTKEVALFGKGNKHRTSYLNARAEVALRLYLSTRNDDNPYLFVKYRKPHTQMSNAGIEKSLRNIGKRVDIEKLYPHRIRHTFATHALNHGMPITDLQGLMGHEKMDTTMIYSKVSKESMRMHHKMYVV